MAPSSLRAAPALLLLLASSAAAQTYAVVDYNKLPACAKSCTVLTNAEKACIPPTQPVTSQNAYQACFCSASSLGGLYSSPTAVCSDVCTSSADQGTLKDYYVNLCTSGVVVTPGADTQTAASTTTVSPTSSPTGSASSSNDDNDASSSSSGGGTWFSTHWKWVVMVIVIFLAMVIGSILGVWLKRRHRRKRDAEGANVAARNVPLFTKANDRRSSRPPPSHPNGALKEMTMSGGVNGFVPQQSSRPATRARSNTANTTHSNSQGYYDQPNGDAYGTNKELGATNVPAPPHPVYAGVGDLPERTYSPVVSRRNSAYMSSRPSSAMQLEIPAHGQSGSMRGYGPPSPATPVSDSEGPITGAQRIREMRSREHMSARSSPLSYSEDPELHSKRSSKRLSKKSGRNAS